MSNDANKIENKLINATGATIGITGRIVFEFLILGVFFFFGTGQYKHTYRDVKTWASDLKCKYTDGCEEKKFMDGFK